MSRERDGNNWYQVREETVTSLASDRVDQPIKVRVDGLEEKGVLLAVRP